MNKIYRLKEDTKNYSVFIEQYDALENSFYGKYWGLKQIDLENFKPLELKLYASDIGKKNFQTDISHISIGSFAFSDKAVTVLKPILDATGQFFPIETESKRKKFYGFYANKKPYDDSFINYNKSDWSQAQRGKMIYKLVLNSSYPKEDYLFTLRDNPSYIYVTDKFKKLVEDNDLKGFDFSQEIPVID